MKLVFLGPPGSGKGTYAEAVGEIAKIPHIAVGGLLRAARDNPKVGKIIREYQDKGLPVPDKIANNVIKERLLESDCKNGFIVDSPYNVKQSKIIDSDKRVAIDAAINIVVPEDLIIARLSARRVCGKCGENYNLRTKILPKKEGICDKCGSSLIHRDDDKEETIKVRIEEYKKRGEPMLKYYRDRGKLINIEWNSSDVQKGNIDVPPQVMIDKIVLALEKRFKVKLK